MSKKLALSVKQPWVWAIFRAGKNIENRTWLPSQDLRGKRIFIHASSQTYKLEGNSKRLAEFAKDLEFIRQRLSEGSSFMSDYSLSDLKNYFKSGIVAPAQYGSIVGSVEIVDFHQSDTDNPWHISGQKGWELTNPIAFPEPIPCKGQLGLWDCTNIVGDLV